MVEGKTAIILAGGQSSRMGRNKAFLIIDENKTIIEQLIVKMKMVAEEVILVTNEPDLYQKFKVRCVTDEIRGKGPLAGIYTGLKASKSWHNFVVACDMPFIDIGLVNYMFEEAPNYDIVAPCIKGKIEPLHAVYSKNCIEAIRKSLQGKSLKLISIYSSVKVKFLTEKQLADYNLAKIFYNINTQADLQKILDLRIEESNP